MYKISSKLRLFSIVLMAVGLIGIIAGFVFTPNTADEVQKVLDAKHNDGHGEATHGDTHSVEINEHIENAEEAHGEAVAHSTQEHGESTSVEEHEGDSHLEHALHQYQNKPWSALYVAAFFFFMIGLGALAFYAVQYAAQAGWSPMLLRVMEAVSGYIIPGGIIMIILFLCAGVFHLNHMFIWMDPEVVANDELIAGKASYLNVPFFLIRAVIYLGGWITYRHFARKFSLKQDDANDYYWHRKSFRAAAMFLVFFMVTESMMSWDWIMSVDPHWFSTLFGWYVLAGMMVCAITVIAMVTMYLKSRGYLEIVNDSHIHDLAKFMFGFSIFWTYLWFSQFMLYWYANIPEEVTYFITRIENYKLLFFGMIVMNFVFPLLLLMNSDYKRVNIFVIMAGIVILAGHYVDIYVMIMPATVGESWSIGLSEISSVLFFLGLFVFVVFTGLTKVPLIPKRNPLIEESKHFHY